MHRHRNYRGMRVYALRMTTNLSLAPLKVVIQIERMTTFWFWAKDKPARGYPTERSSWNSNNLKCLLQSWKRALYFVPRRACSALGQPSASRSRNWKKKSDHRFSPNQTATTFN